MGENPYPGGRSSDMNKYSSLSPEDLIEKTRYYLNHEEEREAIAKRGYARTRNDHTMEKRFTDLFNAIGLRK